MKRTVAVIAGTVLLLSASIAQATDPPELTWFGYYDEGESGWVEADNYAGPYSCGTYCDYYYADYSLCGSGTPHVDGTEFGANFTFTSSGSFYDSEMYVASNLSLDVYENYSKFLSNWYIHSVDIDEGDIDWSYGQTVAYIKLYYNYTIYETRVYYRYIPCK